MRVSRLVAVLAVASSLALAPASRATDVVVTDLDVGFTWFLGDTRPGGSVYFSNVPAAPPLGAGCLRMDTNCTNPPGCSTAKAQLLTDMFGTGTAAGVANPNRPGGGVRLADINAISYWSWRGSGSTNPITQVDSLNLEIDANGDGTWDGIIVYEPYYNRVRQGPIVVDTWQDWDAYDGGNAIWWATRNLPGIPAFTFSTTWAQIVAANPNARIVRFFGFNVGSGWSGVSQNAVDALTLGTTNEGSWTFNFETRRPVRIDVRPNNALNQINTRAKQLVPIAILSEDGWDACEEVDQDSVDVRGAGPLATSSECDDVDGDGLPDLVLKFRARDIEDPTQDECADPDAKIELTGFTLQGQPIAGIDDVTWSGPACD